MLQLLKSSPRIRQVGFQLKCALVCKNGISFVTSLIVRIAKFQLNQRVVRLERYRLFQLRESSLIIFAFEQLIPTAKEDRISLNVPDHEKSHNQCHHSRGHDGYLQRLPLL